MKCISCGTEHDYNFCPDCGEKSSPEKISFKSILVSFYVSFIEMDKGFMYAFKMLTIKPRKFCLDFIEGKRKNVFNPVSFLILNISIYLICESISKSFYQSDLGLQSEFDNSESYKIGLSAGKIFSEYFKYFWILSIFYLGNSTKMIYGRFNYPENLTISCYIIGYATFVATLCLAFMHIPLVFNPLLYLVITVLTYRIFNKPKKDRIESLLLIFLNQFLFILQLFAIMIVLGYLFK